MIEPRRVRIELASEPRCCPACKRVIYQRRRPICEFCDEPIPELQLTDAEQRAINVELAEMNLRRQQEKEREEEKKRTRRGTSDGAEGGAVGAA